MKTFFLLCLGSFTLFAQRPASPGANLIERLNRMSPAQRNKVLDRMPADRRQGLERRIKNLNNIDPEARAILKKDYDSFQQLPPEQQSEVRKTLRQIADLPEDRRRLVRGAIHNLRQHPAEMQQRRIGSRVFQERFNEDERKLVVDALAVLPQQTVPQTAQEQPTKAEH